MGLPPSPPASVSHQFRRWRPEKHDGRWTSGAALGPWTLLRRLGRGGSSEVWRASAHEYGIAAVKILGPGADKRKRFRLELELLTELNGTLGVMPLIAASDPHDVTVPFNQIDCVHQFLGGTAPSPIAPAEDCQGFGSSSCLTALYRPAGAGSAASPVCYRCRPAGAVRRAGGGWVAPLGAQAAITSQPHWPDPRRPAGPDPRVPLRPIIRMNGLPVAAGVRVLSSTWTRMAG